MFYDLQFVPTIEDDSAALHELIERKRANHFLLARHAYGEKSQVDIFLDFDASLDPDTKLYNISASVRSSLLNFTTALLKKYRASTKKEDVKFFFLIISLVLRTLCYHQAPEKGAEEFQLLFKLVEDEPLLLPTPENDSVVLLAGIANLNIFFSMIHGCLEGLENTDAKFLKIIDKFGFLGPDNNKMLTQISKLLEKFKNLNKLACNLYRSHDQLRYTYHLIFLSQIQLLLFQLNSLKECNKTLEQDKIKKCNIKSNPDEKPTRKRKKDVIVNNTVETAKREVKTSNQQQTNKKSTTPKKATETKISTFVDANTGNPVTLSKEELEEARKNGTVKTFEAYRQSQDYVFVATRKNRDENGRHVREMSESERSEAIASGILKLRRAIHNSQRNHAERYRQYGLKDRRSVYDGQGRNINKLPREELRELIASGAAVLYEKLRVIKNNPKIINEDGAVHAASGSAPDNLTNAQLLALPMTVTGSFNSVSGGTFEKASAENISTLKSLVTGS